MPKMLCVWRKHMIYDICKTVLLYYCDIWYYYHHHYKHPGLGHLARSVSRVKFALSIVSLVSQLFSFLVGCKGMNLKGVGFVAFFAGVKASSFCILLSYLVCSLSVVRGEWSRLFCSHKCRRLPEVWLSILRTPYTTQNPQRKHRTDIWHYT
jgi:hypothetical protein